MDGQTVLAALTQEVLLGYSEPAAFFRAFKRWTGETPKSYPRTARTVTRTAAVEPRDDCAPSSWRLR